MDNEQLIIKPKRAKGEDGHRVFSIRVREDIVERLDDMSARTGRSRNELINLFLEYGLQKSVIQESAEE